LYFNIQWVQKWQQAVMNYMSDYFHWDAAATAKHWQALQARIREAKGEAVLLQTTG
jgi:hypothetical protein